MKSNTARKATAPQRPRDEASTDARTAAHAPQVSSRSGGVVTIEDARRSLMDRQRALRMHHSHLFASEPAALTQEDLEYEARRLAGDPANAAMALGELMEASCEARQQPQTVDPVEADPRAFAEGRAFVSALAGHAGSEERTEVHRVAVGDVLAGLFREFEPRDASTRMLIEVAAHSHVDWATFSSSARATAETSTINAARFARLADEAATRALRCIELLKRPNAASMRVSIGVTTAASVAPEGKAHKAGRTVAPKRT